MRFNALSFNHSFASIHGDQVIHIHDLGLLRYVWLTQELEHLLHFDVSLTV